MAALAAQTRIHRHASRTSAVRIGQYAQSRLLSDHVHRLAAVRNGEWRLSRDRRRRQRRDRGYITVHGGRIHAQSSGGAKRRPRFAVEVANDERRVQQKWSGAAFAAALYASA